MAAPPVVTRITFAGESIECIVMPFAPPAFELQTWRTQFAATTGVSEIRGGAGGRPLELPIVLRKKAFTNRLKLEEYIETTINTNLIGQNGKVKIYLPDSTVLEYPDCTCHGFSKMSDPKKDEAGTLNTDYGWFCVGVLRFFQLSNG